MRAEGRKGRGRGSEGRSIDERGGILYDKKYSNNDLSVQDHARFEDILEFVTDFELVDVDYVVIPVNEWEHW